MKGMSELIQIMTCCLTATSHIIKGVSSSGCQDICNHHDDIGSSVYTNCLLCVGNLLCALHFDGLAQDCSISSVLAMELLQSFPKSSICYCHIVYTISTWSTCCEIALRYMPQNLTNYKSAFCSGNARLCPLVLHWTLMILQFNLTRSQHWVR